MPKTAIFHGSLTALVTPFNHGAVDFDALRRHVDWQIESGTHGLVPVGTTGESPTLSHEEHGEVISATIKAAKGRVPVIAGAGSNNTREAVAHCGSRRARRRRRPPHRHALLQQAQSGRALPALQGDQ